MASDHVRSILRLVEGVETFQCDLSAMSEPAEVLCDVGLWMAERNPDSAVAFFEAAATLGSAAALYHMGKLQLRRGRTSLAVDALTRHFELLPDHLDTARSLGKALIEDGEVSAAALHLRDCADRWPQDESLQTLFLRSLVLSQDWEGAWRLFKSRERWSNKAKSMAASAGLRLGSAEAEDLVDALPLKFRRAVL